MEEIMVKVPKSLADKMSQLADEEGVNLSEFASQLLSRGYDSFINRPAIDPARGQRSGTETDLRLDWWRESKFGMFIHWGLYSIAGGIWKGREIPGIGEWIMRRAEIPIKEYERLARRFNPIKFNAAEWVSLARRAGQKYIVITAKHHDGFCLFKSDHTDYNIVDATPFKRDVLKELAIECRRQGIKLGFYYSQTQDWHHPGGDGNYWDYPGEKDFVGYVEKYVKAQLRELLTNYGPVAIIWFDTPRIITRRQSQTLLDLVHELQPDCLVSGRLGNVMGDYASAGNNLIPKEAVNADWETPATINDTWGYKINDQNWKSATDLIYNLGDIVSKGGNYLLNVGPTAEGIIPDPSVERLLEIGKWLSLNGESIYGTQPGVILGQGWCRSTRKGDKEYLLIFQWPEGGKIRLGGLNVERAWLLTSDVLLPVKKKGNITMIIGPEEPPDPICSVVVLALAHTVKEQLPFEQ